MHKFLAAAVVTGGLMIGPQAHALSITPATMPQWSGPETGQAEISAFIAPIIGSALELYKNDNPAESGALAGSYETEFSNTSSDPEDATITYVGGNIVGPTAWLLVKDGNANPGWYLFNLTTLGWDGMEVLELTDFWAATSTVTVSNGKGQGKGGGDAGDSAKGAISHVTLYGTNTDPDPDPVPEPLTLTLLGAALLGAGIVRQRARR